MIGVGSPYNPHLGPFLCSSVLCQKNWGMWFVAWPTATCVFGVLQMLGASQLGLVDRHNRYGQERPCFVFTRRPGWRGKAGTQAWGSYSPVSWQKKYRLLRWESEEREEKGRDQELKICRLWFLGRAFGGSIYLTLPDSRSVKSWGRGKWYMMSLNEIWQQYGMVWIWIWYGYGYGMAMVQAQVRWRGSFSVIVISSEKGGMFDLSVKKPRWRRFLFVPYQMQSWENLVGVSENSGTPKSSILIGFSIINHPFCSTPIFGNSLVDFQS